MSLKNIDHMIVRLLVVTSTFSIFSVYVYGMAFYPIIILAILEIPALFFTTRVWRIRVEKKFLLCFSYFILMIVISLLGQKHLLIDLTKILVLTFVILKLKHFAFQSPGGYKAILNLLDVSVSFLVIFGVIQYLAYLFGFERVVYDLHKLFSNGVGGTPLDLRGGFLRVSSLTLEPSYFAFTVGVFFLLRLALALK